MPFLELCHQVIEAYDTESTTSQGCLAGEMALLIVNDLLAVKLARNSGFISVFFRNCSVFDIRSS